MAARGGACVTCRPVSKPLSSAPHSLVIGGGVIGLTTAWALLQVGHRVSLIEQGELAGGASRANGGQLSYRYVSPLADAGVPWKAIGWLFDPEGPLCFRPELQAAQWSWLAQFLWKCRASVNRAATERLLRLGRFSQQTFQIWQQQLQLQGIALREPGKLVVYRQAGEFAKVRQRMAPDGVEQLLDEAACQRIEPALQASGVRLAGGVFTPGEAVADCHALCLRLAERLRAHPDFVALYTGEAMGFRRSASGALQALRTREGELAADHFVLAAGLGSRALAAGLGVKLPLYPLKGYSLTAPIGPAHRPPEVSVTDFERKILYARMDDRLRVAAMVDLVGADLSLDPRRLAGLQRAVRQMFPQAADFDAAESWAGLRPATPGGTPILGATPISNLWLNVGHGALGFTFAFASARIVAALVAGQDSPLPLDGLKLAA